MPVIVPVVGLIASPFGSPVALKVSVSPSGSVAPVAVVTAAFSAVVWPAIAVTTGGRFTLETVHVKACSADVVPSETDTVRVDVPALV